MLDKILLFPYYLALKIRNHLYDKGIKASCAAPVPTICVGNVTVGGTGKTPHTEMILRELSEIWPQKNIAVLSRGYKRKSRGFQLVTTDGSAMLFGDEPLQIKKKFPNVTVAVDKNRIEGCDLLCHPEKIGTTKSSSQTRIRAITPPDLIILDDAFQYRKLTPTMNILLVDYNRPVHKDRLMPLGSLRDLPQRVEQADVIIVTKSPWELNDWEKTTWAENLGISGFKTSTCTGKSRSGKIQTILFTRIDYCQPEPIFPVSDSHYVYASRMILFTGIARATNLLSYLGGRYKVVRHFNFSDHHRFSWADFRKIQAASRRNPTAAIATTEKDAQRVLDFNGLPSDIKERLLQVPIKVQFLSEREREIFCNKLKEL